MTADEAQRTLASYGLNGQQGDTVFSSDVEKDHVAGQDIAAGATAYKGDTIVFHLSKGPETTNVPNVQGLDFETARDRLEAAGFTVSLQWRNDDSVKVNNVIKQSITGTAEPGTTITLTISNGPEEEEPEEPSGGQDGSESTGTNNGSGSGGSSSTGGSTSGNSATNN